MSKTISLLLAALAAIATSGCMDRPAPDSNVATSGTTKKPTPPPAPAGKVDLPIGSGEASAFALAPGSFLSGSISAPQAATLHGLAVQIGNYGGTADGHLSVELCEGSRCASGRVPLAGSVDNASLKVALEPALTVKPNAKLTYRIIKLEGNSPVAVWIYPSAAGALPATANGTQPVSGTPRLSLHF